MAYFQNTRKREQQDATWSDDLYDDEDLDLDAFDDDDLTYYMTEAERREARRFRFQMAAGLFDFLSVIAGTVVILLLIALLINLITWLQADIDQTFTLLQRNL